jgi:hypothetical protein
MQTCAFKHLARADAGTIKCQALAAAAAPLNSTVRTHKSRMKSRLVSPFDQAAHPGLQFPQVGNAKVIGSAAPLERAIEINRKSG